MAKVRLCSRDENELEELMNGFRDKLEEVGISGSVFIRFDKDGTIHSNFNINEGTVLNVDIENDGNKVVKEYSYD